MSPADPTNDEREALAALIDPDSVRARWSVDAHDVRDQINGLHLKRSVYRSVDRILAAGFRRSGVVQVNHAGASPNRRSIEKPQGEPSEHPAHRGHKFGGAYARAAAMAAGDPDWMNATGGEPQGEPSAAPTPEEWRERIDAERLRQSECGYDRAHDDEHGVDHLLTWAQDYARRGRTIASAALVEAAREMLSGTPR